MEVIRSVKRGNILGLFLLIVGLLALELLYPSMMMYLRVGDYDLFNIDLISSIFLFLVIGVSLFLITHQTNCVNAFISDKYKKLAGLITFSIGGALFIVVNPFLTAYQEMIQTSGIKFGYYFVLSIVSIVLMAAGFFLIIKTAHNNKEVSKH